MEDYSIPIVLPLDYSPSLNPPSSVDTSRSKLQALYGDVPLILLFPMHDLLRTGRGDVIYSLLSNCLDPFSSKE